MRHVINCYAIMDNMTFREMYSANKQRLAGLPAEEKENLDMRTHSDLLTEFSEHLGTLAGHIATLTYAKRMKDRDEGERLEAATRAEMHAAIGQCFLSLSTASLYQFDENIFENLKQIEGIEADCFADAMENICNFNDRMLQTMGDDAMGVITPSEALMKTLNTLGYAGHTAERLFTLYASRGRVPQSRFDDLLEKGHHVYERELVKLAQCLLMLSDVIGIDIGAGVRAVLNPDEDVDVSYTPSSPVQQPSGQRAIMQA